MPSAIGATGLFWPPRWASIGTRTARCSGPEAPRLLRQHLEESLRRLEVQAVDLLYFHAPADDAPLAESAGFFRDVLAEGKTRAVGVSNLSVDQMQAFAAECPIVACQVRYNRLQREIEADVLPWCRTHQVSVVAYEPLALGLLTGKFTRDYVFPDDDWRRRSPLVAGDAWTNSLEEVERLRAAGGGPRVLAGPMGRRLDDHAARSDRRLVRRQTPRSDSRNRSSHVSDLGVAR